MIKMKKMNHILRNFAILPVLAAVLAVSCNKTSGEGANVAIKRQFDAWRAIHYPDAIQQNGIYIIDDTPGTGLEWNKNQSVTFLTYTVRDLDGTVSYNTDERWAKQLGEWDQTYYFGPQIMPTGESVSYAGIDAVLSGMRQGGTRTAIVPSWMMTRNRYDSLDKYLETETDVAAMIFSVTFLDQTDDLADYEFRNLRQYAMTHWNVSDTLSTAPVFFKSFTNFNGEPAEMPKDTTVYIDYIGRRVSDGQVFDTTIADTAKFYHIYDPSRTYKPVSVTWGENATDIKLSGSSTIDGFAHGLYAMHAGEKASFAFGYSLGYGSTGGSDTNMIPPYSALQFDVELVPEP
jgi:FKBP-type peptidyl-prolyl cis-trans isomerase 2